MKIVTLSIRFSYVKKYAFCLQIDADFHWRRNHVTHFHHSENDNTYFVCRNLWDKWVREPDDRSRQSSGIHTFTRDTCTAVTLIYSAVADCHGLYNMFKNS